MGAHSSMIGFANYSRSMLPILNALSYASAHAPKTDVCKMVSLPPCASAFAFRFCLPHLQALQRSATVCLSLSLSQPRLIVIDRILPITVHGIGDYDEARTKLSPLAIHLSLTLADRLSIARATAVRNRR